MGSITARMNKDKYEKTDSIDARKLSKYLKAGLLRSVSIPDVKREQLRSLFRRRVQLVKNIRSVKNVIWNQNTSSTGKCKLVKKFQRMGQEPLLGT